MEAITKIFEVIPDAEGNQLLTIPAAVAGTADQTVKNPRIDIGVPRFGKTSFSFNINIWIDALENPVWKFSESMTYDELFAAYPGGSQAFSAYYNSGASNDQEFFGYLMTALAYVLDIRLQEVSWLKGLIQEKT